MDFGFPALRYSTPEKRIEFYRELTEASSVAARCCLCWRDHPLPVAGGFDSTSIEIEFQPCSPATSRWLIATSQRPAIFKRSVFHSAAGEK